MLDENGLLFLEHFDWQFTFVSLEFILDLSQLKLFLKGRHFLIVLLVALGIFHFSCEAEVIKYFFLYFFETLAQPFFGVCIFEHLMLEFEVFLEAVVVFFSLRR